MAAPAAAVPFDGLSRGEASALVALAAVEGQGAMSAAAVAVAVGGLSWRGVTALVPAAALVPLPSLL